MAQMAQSRILPHGLRPLSSLKWQPMKQLNALTPKALEALVIQDPKAAVALILKLINEIKQLKGIK